MFEFCDDQKSKHLLGVRKDPDLFKTLSKLWAKSPKLLLKAGLGLFSKNHQSKGNFEKFCHTACPVKANLLKTYMTMDH